MPFLGNDNIHELTQRGVTLRIELEGWDGTAKFAEYTTFFVAGESDNYQLAIGGYTGNMSMHSVVIVLVYCGMRTKHVVR